MWDLTPPTDLLQEFPAEYSTESALADLTVSFLIRILYITDFLLFLMVSPLFGFLIPFPFHRIMHYKLCGQIVKEKES